MKKILSISLSLTLVLSLNGFPPAQKIKKEGEVTIISNGKSQRHIKLYAVDETEDGFNVIKRYLGLYRIFFLGSRVASRTRLCFLSRWLLPISGFFAFGS